MIGVGIVVLLLVPVIASLVVRFGFSQLVAAVTVLTLAILVQLLFGSSTPSRIFGVATRSISGLIDSPAAVWLVLSCLLGSFVETSPVGRFGKMIAVPGNALAAQRTHLAMWLGERSRLSALATIHPLGVTTIIVTLTADLSLGVLASALFVPFLILAVGYEWLLLQNTKEHHGEVADSPATFLAAMGAVAPLGAIFSGLATPAEALAITVFVVGGLHLVNRAGQNDDGTFGTCLAAAGIALVLFMLAVSTWSILGLGNRPDLLVVMKSSSTFRSASLWGLLILAIFVSATGGALLACIFVWPLVAIFKFQSGDQVHLACMFLFAVALGDSLARQTESKRDGRWIFALITTFLIVTFFPWIIRILPEFLQD